MEDLHLTIKTTDEYVVWKNVTYLIDRENELAFVPSQIRDAGLCYRNLMRRGKISTIWFLEETPEKPVGKLARFFRWMEKHFLKPYDHWPRGL